MQLSTNLKKRLVIACIAVLCVLAILVVSSYAWYIYNTNAHTTNVDLAVGTGMNLRISSTPDGDYTQATVLDEFVGVLTPVSTDKITNGFQKADKFSYTIDHKKIHGIAYAFGEVDNSEYYKTTLYLKTNSVGMDVYVSDITFKDSDEDNPISSAIRLGLVVHEPGKNKPVSDEFIFAISDKANPNAYYNTANGQDGDVLDSTKTDGSVVPFTPYTKNDFCIYDEATGDITIKDNSVSICKVTGDGKEYGDSVQIDVYIWLEGCDKDCIDNLAEMTLENISISFAGKKQQ